MFSLDTKLRDIEQHPLLIACKYNHLELTRLLLNYVTTYDRKIILNKSLMNSIVNKNLEIIEILLTETDFNFKNGIMYNFLESAAVTANFDVFKRIFKEQQLHSEDHCLEYAAKYGSYDICNFIIKNKYHSKKITNSDFISEIPQDWFEILKIIIENTDINPAAYDNKAIKSAYNKKNMKVFNLLYKQKDVREKISKFDLKLYKQFIVSYNINGF